MSKRYWRPGRDYYDQELIRAKQEARKDLAFLIESGTDAEIRAYARAQNPKITEDELDEVVRLAHDARREREQPGHGRF